MKKINSPQSYTDSPMAGLGILSGFGTPIGFFLHRVYGRDFPHF